MIEHAIFLYILQKLTILKSKYLLLLCLKKFLIILLKICCPVLAMRSKMRYPLKVHCNSGVFLGFCRNWFLIDPFHYFSSCSDFGLEFAEIFVIKKRLPDLASRRLFDSAFECLKENSASRRVALVSQGVAF